MSQMKFCAVCGDRAQSNNFNAITCESCKAFFRRNALAKKPLTCVFDQNCEITVVTRKFCQKCRLKKCLDVGMKSENIMTEEDKQIKRRKIEINRTKKRKLDQSPTNDTELNAVCSTEANVTHPQIPRVEMKSLDICADVMHAKEMVDFIISDPDRSSLAINELMPSAANALVVLRKIFTSPEDNALRFVSHLIQFPGDALRIVNKIMASTLDALTVITNLLSSPKDALEIIEKILDRPSNILKFIKELLNAPEEATNIMNKFKIMPTEAIRIIKNSICDIELTQSIKSDIHSVPSAIQQSHLIQAIPVEISKSTVDNIPAHCKLSGNKSIKVPDEVPVPPVFVSETICNYNDNLNSLGSVLSEVVRIEYEIFKNEPTHSQVYVRKQQPEQCFLESYSKDSRFQHAYQKLSETERCADALSCQVNSVVTAPDCTQREYRQLNDVELNKLRELQVASEALYLPVDNDLSALMGDDRIKSEDNCQNPKLVQVINLTAVAIKRLIKMAKKITAFRNMCQEDQIALLKGGCTEMMIIRSVTNYDYDRNTWRIPHTKEDMSNIRAEVLKLAKGNVYEEHLKFITTFDEKWRMDENIILIICAIVLFTPNRSCAVHRDVIRSEQNSYYYLLHRYLESIYEGGEAKSAFMELKQKITDVARLNQFIIGVYLNVNPSLVEPLLREIFDLKNVNI